MGLGGAGRAHLALGWPCVWAQAQAPARSSGVSLERRIHCQQDLIWVSEYTTSWGKKEGCIGDIVGDSGKRWQEAKIAVKKNTGSHINVQRCW